MMTVQEHLLVNTALVLCSRSTDKCRHALSCNHAHTYMIGEISLGAYCRRDRKMSEALSHLHHAKKMRKPFTLKHVHSKPMQQTSAESRLCCNSCCCS